MPGLPHAAKSSSIVPIGAYNHCDHKSCSQEFLLDKAWIKYRYRIGSFVSDIVLVVYIGKKSNEFFKRKFN